MSIEVYGRRNSLNVQKVMWALGELGLGYHRHDVGGSFGYPDDYAALNPNPLVPALADGEVRMWESNACVRYLARTYGEGGLWPGDPAALACADQWMDWQATRLAPAFLPAFIQLIRMPEEQRNSQAIEAGLASAATLYRLLDRHLAEHAAGLDLGHLELQKSVDTLVADAPDHAVGPGLVERLECGLAHRFSPQSGTKTPCTGGALLLSPAMLCSSASMSLNPATRLGSASKG